MKLEEIIVESNLEEGPILNKIGAGIGKAAGTMAKGVGAVAGGVAGLGSAFKKGFQSGKAQVAKAGDEEEPVDQPATATTTATQSTAKPAATSTATTKKPTSSYGRLSAAAFGEPGTTTAPASTATTTTTTTTAAPQAKSAATTTTLQTAPAVNPQARPAAISTQPAAQAKADTAYAQAQKAIMSLQPAERQKIIATLKSDPTVKAALAQKKPTATTAATASPATASTGQALNPATKTKEPKLAGEEPPATNPATTKPAAAAPRGDVEVSPTDKFNPNTGEMTPQYKADLEKRVKSLQKKPAATATTAQPAATPNANDKVGQAAISAYNASNGDMDAAEKAALDQMKAKNPRLAGMIKQAGMDKPAATASTPQNKIKITGTKSAAKRATPTIQAAGKENLGNSLIEKIEEYKNKQQ